MLMVYLTESSGITEVSTHVIMQQSNEQFYELKLITPVCPLFEKAPTFTYDCPTMHKFLAILNTGLGFNPIFISIF